MRVREAFTDAVMRAAAPDHAEAMRFPPLLPRYQIEKNGYLASFPHLAGSVFSFDGSDAEATGAGGSSPRATRTGAGSRR